MSRWTFTFLVVALSTASALAQTPRPFPTPPAGTPGPRVEQPAAPPAAKPAASDPAGAPTELTLGVPIYPNAQFLKSYDAGRGQRYYLFGAQAGFTEVITYYRTLLKQKGEVIFDQPPTQMFEVGKFKADTMAFPSGVTVKDFTFGGSDGYINPKPDATPRYFPTVIQIVPVPAGSSSR